jgi:ferredoxin
MIGKFVKCLFLEPPQKREVFLVNPPLACYLYFSIYNRKMNIHTYPIVGVSTPGRFFVDESCIYCEFCVETAPANFAYESTGGFAYVSAQPTNQEELDQIAEALEGCPTESIGDRDNPNPNYMHHLANQKPIQ